MASRHSTSKIPNLTAPAIQAAKPRATAYVMHGPNYPGLALRVSPAGGKVFRWHVLDRATGKIRVITLGEFTLHPAAGRLTLTKAGDVLEDLKAAHAAGALAKAEAELRAALKPPSPPDPADTSPLVKDVADDFYKRRIQPHRKRHEETKGLVEKEITAVLGERTVASITTADCARLVEKVVDRGAKAHAGKVLGLLKQLFKFAEGRDLIQRNPAGRLDPDDLGIVLGRRKRWLTDKEIPIFWAALNERTDPVYVERHDPRTGKTQKFKQTMPTLGDTTRAGLRLLLLTGVRSGELLQAEWEHVDFKAATWTIPVANQKLSPKQARDAHAFVIPLVPAAVEQFKALQKAAKGAPWLMVSPDPESKLGRYEDHSLNHAMRRLFGGKTPTVKLEGGPVSPHDLRRTMRTHLGKLRIPPHITERCLNHSLGRIVQIYDQGDYIEERREALERWAAYVERLVTGKGAEVVAITVAGGHP